MKSPKAERKKAGSMPATNGRRAVAANQAPTGCQITDCEEKGREGTQLKADPRSGSCDGLRNTPEVR